MGPTWLGILTLVGVAYGLLGCHEQQDVAMPYGRAKRDQPTNITVLTTAEERRNLVGGLSKDHEYNVVVVGAVWCTPCAALKFQIKEHAAEYQNVNFVLVELPRKERYETRDQMFEDRFTRTPCGGLPYVSILDSTGLALPTLCHASRPTSRWDDLQAALEHLPAVRQPPRGGARHSVRRPPLVDVPATWQEVPALDLRVDGYRVSGSRGWRMAVPGGWMLLLTPMEAGAGPTSARGPSGMLFLFDPEHQWSGVGALTPPLSPTAPLPGPPTPRLDAPP